ncbi:hypothetical protein BZG35_03880 [Brevundimonas sp. LM2]|uniref:hypothetical protein n=1 Tax=Brevundimonas sp. LM2 TaxID=1938605 RepID=UPI000983BC56|nr:hypothetical protein [Brevundimonas sp. LM2]AQR60888.1 hypothetical protein BZG35_03880 [Brevundimonas sp. LM2]
MIVHGTVQALRAVDEALLDGNAGAVWKAKVQLGGVLAVANADDLTALAGLNIGGIQAWWRGRLGWDVALREKVFSTSADAVSYDLKFNSDLAGGDSQVLAIASLVVLEALPEVIDILAARKGTDGLLRLEAELALALLELSSSPQHAGEFAKCRSALISHFYSSSVTHPQVRGATPRAPILEALVRNPNYLDLLRNFSTAEIRAATKTMTAFIESGGKDARLRGAVVAALLLFGPAFLERQQIDWMLKDPDWRAQLLGALGPQQKVYWNAQQAEIAESFATLLFEAVGDYQASSDLGEWIILAETVLKSVKVASLYGQPTNMKALQVARGKLVDAFVRETIKVPLLSSELKSRVAVILAHTDLSTETLTALSYIRAFKRPDLEVEIFVCPHSAGSYAPGSLQDELTALADRFEVLNEGVERAAIRILRRSPAVALFLNSVTWGISDYILLAASRVARIQATTYVSATTTGFPNMDVWISGKHSERSSRPSANYSEKLMLKPGSAVCFPANEIEIKDPECIVQVESKPAFISGANFYKLNRTILTTWMKLLALEPTAVLKLYPFNPNWDPLYPRVAFRQWLSEIAHEQGVDPARIELIGPWDTRSEMLAALPQARVYLDSFPHSGGLSTLDPLLMGLPVVTQRGSYQRSTQGADILDAMDRSNWVAQNEEAYIQIARRLLVGGDVLKADIDRLRGSPILNEDAFEAELGGVVEGLMELARAEPQLTLPSKKSGRSEVAIQSEEDSDYSFDGLWRFGTGFSFEEAPVPDIGITKPYRWTDGRSASITVSSSVIANRTVRLRLRTFVLGQSIGVTFNGELIGWSIPLVGDLSQVQSITFRGDFRYGQNLLELVPAETHLDSGGRSLAFILEGVRIDAADPGPSIDGYARWTVLSGFHDWENPPHDGWLAHPFRWTMPPESTFEVVNHVQDATRMTIVYRSAVPGQVLTALLEDVGSFDGVPHSGDLAQEGRLVIEHAFSAGRYVIQLKSSEYLSGDRPIGVMIERIVFE